MGHEEFLKRLWRRVVGSYQNRLCSPSNYMDILYWNEHQKKSLLKGWSGYNTVLNAEVPQ